MSQPRRSTRKKRQTQLTFTPLPSSSPAASQYPEKVRQRAASVRYDDAMSSPTKKRRVGGSPPVGSPFSRASSNAGSPFGSQKVQVVIPSPSKSSDQLPTPAASSQVEMDNEPEPQKRSPLSGNPSKQNALSNSMQPVAGANTTTGDDGRSFLGFTSEEGDDDVPIRSIRRTRPAPTTLTSDDSSQPQTPQRLVTPTKESRLSQSYTQASSPPFETDNEAPTRRLRQKLSISPHVTRATNSDPRAKAGPSEARSAKKRAKPVVITDGSEDSSSEDVVATPVRKRRTVAQIQSPTRETDHEEESESSDDLQGELEDLKETGTPLRSTRTRDGHIMSERGKRQQKLEELRRRRAGIREESQEEDEQNGQDEDEQDDIEEANLSWPEPIHHAMRRGGNLDQYEDDFVDDEDDNVGVDLGVAGVPLELTHHANKKPFEYFKTEIEWMVHNKLNPAFDRYDEMYELAYRKLDKEVEGFVGSKFASSVWGEEFNKALKARPDLYRIDVPTMLEHKCDACRRSNHPPKHKITFCGKPYNRDTLETIEHDDDDDTEDSDDDESSSTQEGESFFLGRFCCANAEMAHALHHWRYALNQGVLAWLAAEGHLSPAKIVERDNLRQKKRQKATNKVVDGMKDTGVMKMLYKQFKENLAAARDAKPERFTNGH
ncbi:hypothetical protein HO133_001406 [Letharia lupina]|uniref:DUF4211 domain-containing protein n=1 Tax=Letharia lupina TaxID=560253 RepID=A0A8H6FBI5_9LECA|nr:uncharacterized protein HO133_001406 [Letharia lupina]KAF6222320.1 hypothetical protein HO133_001406 [Letharia lupina]